MKTIQIRTLSAVIGAAAFGLILLAASAAAPQSVATALATLLRVQVISPVEVVGMPAAEDIVNFDSFAIQGDSQGVINIPPGVTTSIYSVPITHRLVIADWSAQVNVSVVSLFQDFGGVLTAKASPVRFMDPGLPFVFEPGSALVLRNSAVQTHAQVFLNFSGYLEEL